MNNSVNKYHNKDEHIHIYSSFDKRNPVTNYLEHNHLKQYDIWKYYDECYEYECRNYVSSNIEMLKLNDNTLCNITYLPHGLLVINIAGSWKFKKMDYLPSGLYELNLSHFFNISLINLPVLLHRIIISNTNIDTISNLPNNLIYLYIYDSKSYYTDTNPIYKLPNNLKLLWISCTELSNIKTQNLNRLNVVLTELDYSKIDLNSIKNIYKINILYNRQIDDKIKHKTQLDNNINRLNINIIDELYHDRYENLYDGIIIKSEYIMEMYFIEYKVDYYLYI